MPRLLGRMIETMTAELDVQVKSGGSTTFKRRDLEKGIEPDECYWVQHEAAVRDLAEIDRLGVLAALGVGEAWRYDGSRLTVLVRNDAGEFVEQPTSHCFPWLPVDSFVAQLGRAEGIGETTWIRGFQQWVRDSLRMP